MSVPAMPSRTVLAGYLDIFAENGGIVPASPVERFCLVAESDKLARDRVLPSIEELTERYRRDVSAEPPGLATDSDLDPEGF